jgi:flavin reductase (DIM6/NTAB) family NADH-FMN oxidoreductase RutF
MNEGERSAGLAAALGRIPSGLFVVTVRRGDAETGMLASWVQQCSFEPPQLSLCVRRDRTINDWLTPDVAFTVNILDRDAKALVGHFGRGFEAGEPAFDGLAIERPEGAPPVLSAALAYLECRVVQRLSAGDHDLIIGRVVNGRLLVDGHPWLHVRKNGLRY